MKKELVNFIHNKIVLREIQKFKQDFCYENSKGLRMLADRNTTIGLKKFFESSLHSVIEEVTKHEKI